MFCFCLHALCCFCCSLVHYVLYVCCGYCWIYIYSVVVIVVVVILFSCLLYICILYVISLCRVCTYMSALRCPPGTGIHNDLGTDVECD